MEHNPTEIEHGGRFGVVYTHMTVETYEDLVGPTYGSSSEATEAYFNDKRAAGHKGTIVQQQADGTWLTLYSRQTPAQWIRSKVEGGLA